MDGGDSLSTLAHELQHVEDWLAGCATSALNTWSHANAIDTQNMIHGALYDLTPKKYQKPRTAYMRPGGNPQGSMPKGP